MSAVLEVIETNDVPEEPTTAVVLRHATLARAVHAQLMRSRYNVRRKGAPNTELKALIRSQGLLQNLVGYWQMADGARTTLIEIVAGERRMHTVGELIAEGALPVDYEIPVLIVDEEEAIQISLAENMGREPMHPADLFDAMLALANAGRSADELALAFGTDTAAVRRWLRLARVAPPLLDLYRKGVASYEQMAALAVTEDQDAQRRAWDGLSANERQPFRLRQALTVGEVNVRTDRVVRFVGVPALEAAGAVIRRDLFSEQGDGYLADTALLEDLAVARLERLAQRVKREGHAWVAVVLRADHAFIAGYGRTPLVQLEPSSEQRQRLDSIEQAITQMQADDLSEVPDKQRATHARRLRILRERRSAIERELLVPEAAYRDKSGALVTLDYDGRPAIHRHLIRPEDKLAAGVGRGAPKGERPLHPERLLRTMTTHRTLALAAEVVQRPHIALALAVRALWRGVDGAPRTPLGISVTPFSFPLDLVDCAAARTLAARERWLRADIPLHPSIEWLIAQPHEKLTDMLALAVALSIDTVQADEHPHPGFTEIASAVGLDMRVWWQPTAEAYFNHLTKGRIVETVCTAVSPSAALPLERATKEVAAQLAERALAHGSWLPPILRVSAPAGGDEASKVTNGDRMSV